MLSVTKSAAILGVSAVSVTVEANSGQRGDPRLVVVGLPDTAVKESIDRVQAALSNCGFSLPRTRVTVNLAPADLKKEGSSFDLPMAVALLAASKQLKCNDLSKFMVCGELALSGAVREVRGGVAMAILAKKLNLRGLILPPHAAVEASIVEGVDVYSVESLTQTVALLESPPKIGQSVLSLSSLDESYPPVSGEDFQEIKGQERVKRAVEVAVAGGHNLLMIGPPGSGKSMIAKRIPSILPPPTIDEFIEIVQVHSISGSASFSSGKRKRPFRSPHHTISDVGLIGGGSLPQPGEISLAHRGVLFLDELPEFKRSVLEVLRQPLEDGQVTISRSAAKITLPCRFMLVAAMNPCPCGFLGDARNSCRCSIPQIHKYRSKISGPLLDRIDLQIEVPSIRISELQKLEPGDDSYSIRTRIEKARKIQEARFSANFETNNSEMSSSTMEKTCALSLADKSLLNRIMDQLGLSARAYSRILKVSRTIADLDDSESIEKNHLLEAVQYRNFDRKLG